MTIQSFARAIRSIFQFSFKIWAKMGKLTNLFCKANPRPTFARIAASQPKKTALPFNYSSFQLREHSEKD